MMAGIIQKTTFYVGMIWDNIAYIGWYVVGLAIVLFFSAPYLKERYLEWKRRRDEAEYSAKYHKNPDLVENHLRGIERARQKMQEEYNARLQLAKEAEEQKKEAKKQEIQKLLDNSTMPRRIGKAGPSKLHDEYNPLMGDSSRGYRPPKRSCCGKGGCG